MQPFDQSLLESTKHIRLEKEQGTSMSVERAVNKTE